MKINRPPQKEIDTRLRELYKAMQEPGTLDEIAQRTGRSKKSIYKDIAKLGIQGCKICSKLNVYWLEA